jgi:PKD repeat protein
MSTIRSILISGILMGTLILIGCGGGGSSPSGQSSSFIPSAAFTVSSASPIVNETVAFTDTSVGSPMAWSWTFGDGAVSSVQNPSHAFTATGSYTVTLTVSNSAGSTLVSHIVTVNSAPAAVTVGVSACPIDFTEMKPTGIGNSPLPTISVNIKSRCGAAIDISSIDMYLDWVKIYPTASGSGSEVAITYVTQSNLNEWEQNATHEVDLLVKDVNGTKGDITWYFWVK